MSYLHMAGKRGHSYKKGMGFYHEIKNILNEVRNKIMQAI